MIAVVVIIVMLAAGFAFLRQRSLVDWTDVRAVVLESDDWGLCGFTPDRTTMDETDVEAIDPGRTPDIYHYSTLETADHVTGLADLLARHKGRDGLVAVFQPNYIVGSMSLEPAPEADGGFEWRRRSLPDLPEAYRRPGLWDAVDDAIGRGVWWPEYHGRWHYHPKERIARVAANAVAEEATKRGLLLFPDIASSFELSLARDPEVLAAELSEGLAVFENLFGRRPTSVIAPDYAWNRDRELMWGEEGLFVIQAKREQRSLTKLSASLWDRMLKVVDRGRLYLTERHVVYLHRNCLLEGAQEEDHLKHAAACLESVQAAWRLGEPAIINTHRVNYVHLDTASVDLGRDILDRTLTHLENDPDGAPIYLTDHEVAQLARRGISARHTGDHLLLRNLSHTRRPVLLTDESDSETRLCWLPARSSLVLDADQILPD